MKEEAKFQPGQSSMHGKVPAGAEFQLGQGSSWAGFKPRQSSSQGRVPCRAKFQPGRVPVKENIQVEQSSYGSSTTISLHYPSVKQDSFHSEKETMSFIKSGRAVRDENCKHGLGRYFLFLLMQKDQVIHSILLRQGLNKLFHEQLVDVLLLPILHGGDKGNFLTFVFNEATLCPVFIDV